MQERKEEHMNEEVEFKVTQDLKALTYRMGEVKKTGKKLIASLAEHVNQKHSEYLKLVDSGDLQLTLEFFGTRLLVKAIIPLSASPSGGTLAAFILPVKEKDEPLQVEGNFTFDELGNVNTQFSTTDFPIHFVTHFTDKLIKKGLPIC